jgi:hypothetical protein
LSYPFIPQWVPHPLARYNILVHSVGSSPGEVVDQWHQTEDTRDPTCSDEEVGTGGQNLVRLMGWCPMQNAWVTSWIGGSKGLADHEGHKGRNRSWESTSTPLQWTDPQPLLTVPGTPQVGKNFFLDEPCPVQGFVSVAPTSLAWKDKVGRYEVKLTQGLAVSLHAQHSWTIPSGAWTHCRALFRGEPEELVRVFHSERIKQEALENRALFPEMDSAAISTAGIWSEKDPGVHHY